jgi:hypothetical protein
MTLPERAQIENARWHRDTAADTNIPTGYTHSFTKATLTALEIQEGYVDPVWVVGSSGAAFRIWAHKDLCPSATSVFSWCLLPAGLRNAGWHCRYFSRLWHESDVEEERRRAAHEAIKEAIAAGKAPICWDVAVPEWGVLTGYDDSRQEYAGLSVFAAPATMKYVELGKRDIPIMSVTIIDEPNGIDRREAILNAFRTAVRHAEQSEWEDRPDYQDGLAAFGHWADALDRLAQSGGKQEMLAYYSGTYLVARHYARRYVQMASTEFGGDAALLAAVEAYAQVEAALQDVYGILGKDGQRSKDELKSAATAVRAAGAAEAQAIGHLKVFLAKTAVA